MPIATGFDFEPLLNGDVLIEFFGDDGETFNTQVVAPSVIENIPLVAALTKVALTKGPVVARKVMAMLNEPSNGE